MEITKNEKEITRRVYPFISVFDREGNRLEIDTREIEMYAYRPAEDGNDLMTLYFKSGREVTLDAKIDQEMYPGDDLSTLVDSILRSHYWHDNETPTSID